jgi:hypothetical protein
MIDDFRTSLKKYFFDFLRTSIHDIQIYKLPI